MKIKFLAFAHPALLPVVLIKSFEEDKVFIIFDFCFMINSYIFMLPNAVSQDNYAFMHL